MPRRELVMSAPSLGKLIEMLKKRYFVKDEIELIQMKPLEKQALGIRTQAWYWKKSTGVNYLRDRIIRKLGKRYRYEYIYE